MAVALEPPIEPALARGKPELPVGERWLYEPKYDGFRAIVFVDGDEVYIQSRGQRPLRRYFPELRFPSGQYVLDGEIVIDAVDGHEDFNALQNRLHPAESRVALLSQQTPARFIAFDLLAREDRELLARPFTERRAELVALVEAWGTQPATGVTVTALSADPADCEPWLATGEGVVAKLADAAYAPGKRTAMVKVKRIRTIDCVVMGYRPGKAAGTVGSLLLGLYDEAGELHNIGHSSGIRPELVVEIRYDHASGGRIRHGTKILAWRTDKAPEECRLVQMD